MRPGVPVHFTGVGTTTGENSCTLSFLYRATVVEKHGRQGRGPRRVVNYASTAGHCVLVDPNATEEVHEPGSGPVVFLTQLAADGSAVAGPRIGEVVYTGSSVPALYPDENLPDFMDLAIIELDAGLVTDPAVCHFGGPTSLNQSPLMTPEPVRQYGNGNLTGLNRETGTTLLPARTGIGSPAGHENIIATTIANSGGDSGSPILDSSGRALALVTGPYQPRIAPQLERAKQVLGLDLQLRTAPLAAAAAPFGADTACAPLPEPEK